VHQYGSEKTKIFLKKKQSDGGPTKQGSDITRRWKSCSFI